MKVLITGSNGLLGQKLIRLLNSETRYKLLATSHSSNKLPQELSSVEYAFLDITQKDKLHALVSEKKPDVIVHTAALTDVDKCEVNKEQAWEINVEGTRNLIEASQINNSYLLHLSTDFIFDGESGPYKEGSEPNPINYYGQTKLAAEELLQNSNIRYGIARTVLVYGYVHDLNRSNIILWVRKNLEKGIEIPVVEDQFRTPTLAEDLAMGCYLMIKGQHEGVFNISGQELLTPYDMALQTADFFKLDKKYIRKVNASIFKQVAQRPLRTGFDISKAISVLGFKPHSFSEGISIMASQLEEVNNLC